MEVNMSVLGTSINIGRYSKLIAAVLAAAGYIVADNVLDVNDLLQIGTALLGVAAVYLAPANKAKEELQK